LVVWLKEGQMIRPFYQAEYDRLTRLFREKRALMRRIFDNMDADTTGHDWPGIHWAEALRDLDFLAIQLATLRKASLDRDENLEGVPHDR
jgi:hypothetical protein